MQKKAEKKLERISDSLFRQLTPTEIRLATGGTLSFEQTGTSKIEVTIDP